MLGSVVLAPFLLASGLLGTKRQVVNSMLESAVECDLHDSTKYGCLCKQKRTQGNFWILSSFAFSCQTKYIAHI